VEQVCALKVQSGPPPTARQQSFALVQTSHVAASLHSALTRKTYADASIRAEARRRVSTEGLTIELGARKGDVPLVVHSWREVDFAGVVLAGLIAGYIMAVAGLWAGRVPGLVAVDIADFGRRYMVSDRPSAWMLGLASHLANSVILTFVWAAVLEPNSSWPRWIEGAAFGLVLALTLAGALVAPMSGLGFMGRKTGGPSFAMTSALVHLVWGAAIGLIYVPR
jgi:hypothetical protein